MMLRLHGEARMRLLCGPASEILCKGTRALTFIQIMLEACRAHRGGLNLTGLNAL
jgi:hypothetical protein